MSLDYEIIRFFTFMKCFQKELRLSAKPRGLNLITNEVIHQIPEINHLSIGIAHIFICHTSASLTINENASRDVRTDMETHFNRLIPEGAQYYQHTSEGPDDMPAHIKSSIFGSSLTIPISEGRFNLGTWQGIYLCEHRNKGEPRRLIVTLFGTLAS